MDGIMTGEQVWVARTRRAEAHTDEHHRSIPRALREADETVRTLRERREGNRGRICRLTAWWVRGWQAFVSAMGEPYLSLAGREWVDIARGKLRASEEPVEVEDDERKRCA